MDPQKSAHRLLETSGRGTLQPFSLLPFQLRDPEFVFFAVVEDGKLVDIFSLFQGVRIGGDGPHLTHLEQKHENDHVAEQLWTDHSEEHTQSLTVAFLPSSKHSCRSSLSLWVATMGLRVKSKTLFITLIRQLI